MDEIIKLSGFMWDEEEAVRKLYRVLAALLFCACLFAAAGRLNSFDTDGYSAAGAFVQGKAGEAGEQGAALREISESLSFAIPAPVPIPSPVSAPAVNPEAQRGAADMETKSVPAAAPAESSSAAAVVGEGEVTEEPVTALPAVLTVHLYGNGGSPAVVTVTEQADGVSSENWSIPQRPGKVFDGWYLDAAGTRPFEEVQEGTETLELYAGWRELTGFVCDDAGHILSCTSDLVITDGLLVMPDVSACTGIEAGALTNVADQIMEIYIPANIRYIAPGAFEGLPNLMYIEVAAENPDYYSEGGILYASDGEVIGCPVWYVGD